VDSLEAVVRMKLIANRRKDQVHLLDLIGIGLLDATWPVRLPPQLGTRLPQLLDAPNGDLEFVEQGIFAKAEPTRRKSMGIIWDRVVFHLTPAN
jgi:hypothetical protein